MVVISFSKISFSILPPVRVRFFGLDVSALIKYFLIVPHVTQCTRMSSCNSICYSICLFRKKNYSLVLQLLFHSQFHTLHQPKISLLFLHVFIITIIISIKLDGDITDHLEIFRSCFFWLCLDSWISFVFLRYKLKNRKSKFINLFYYRYEMYIWSNFLQHFSNLITKDMKIEI